MTTPMLSLIVPVYNVAPFLDECLRSLMRLQPAADEIIVVDDGSTDGCADILAAWLPRMSNMRVIRQPNGGLSAARNTGLEVARGKYVAFVDSDDFVESDAYAKMIALAEVDGLDMVLANAWYYFEGREPERLIYTDLRDEGVSAGGTWLSKRLRDSRLLHMVWLHLYRRDFIEEQKLRFIPRLIHEDVLWTTEALLRAQRIRVLNSPIYHYRIRPRPMSPPQRDQHMQRLVESSVRNAEGLAELARTQTTPLREQLAWQSVDGGMTVFHKLEQIADSELRGSVAKWLLERKYASLLWQTASNWQQRKRILRNAFRLKWWARCG